MNASYVLPVGVLIPIGVGVLFCLIWLIYFSIRKRKEITYNRMLSVIMASFITAFGITYFLGLVAFIFKAWLSIDIPIFNIENMIIPLALIGSIWWTAHSLRNYYRAFIRHDNDKD